MLEHPALVIAGCIAALVAILFAALYVFELVSRRRWNALARAGRKVGLNPAVRQSSWPEDARANLAIGRRGGSDRTIRNVLRAEPDGIDLLVFDFRYVHADNRPTMGFGFPHSGGRDVYEQTIVLLRVDGASLPRFELRAADTLHAKTACFRGWEDIEIPAELRVGREYLLRGERGEDILAVLPPELGELLGVSEGLSIDAGGGWIAVYRPDVRVEPAQLGDLVDDAVRIANFLRPRSPDAEAAHRTG